MNSRHQPQPHQLASRNRSLTLWRIAVTVMGMMMAMAVMVPGSTNQVSRSGASVNNSDVPAASRSQVPESVATPQPWSGGTPSRVPGGVSTPPPFSTNSAPAPAPKPKASRKTIYDQRTGQPASQAIANGTVYQFRAKSKKVNFWKTDYPLDGVWLQSADKQTLTWLSSTSQVDASNSTDCGSAPPRGPAASGGRGCNTNATCTVVQDFSIQQDSQDDLQPGTLSSDQDYIIPGRDVHLTGTTGSDLDKAMQYCQEGGDLPAGTSQFIHTNDTMYILWNDGNAGGSFSAPTSFDTTYTASENPPDDVITFEAKYDDNSFNDDPSKNADPPLELPVVEVESVEFVQAGTTGDLFANPNGAGGTPAFGGGVGFFPDASTFATRNTSRNIVRIRAILKRAVAGVPVYFRSFDVDDPSTNRTIDPNGNGRDNRGTVVGAGFNTPGPSAPPGGNGYRGRLRPVGGAFAADGAIVTVNTVLVGGQAIAEVELATSFAPGDNFRVVASTRKPIVEHLDDLSGVPTVGDIPDFKGAATSQLSVWRRFHIEQDRMAATNGDKQDGNITGSKPPAAGKVVVQTDINIPKVNSYQRGILRVGGVNYPIVSNTMGVRSSVTVTSAVALPNDGEVTIFQDDWSAVANAIPTPREDTSHDANIYDMLQATTVRANNRYADAYLQPELDALNEFDSANAHPESFVTATPHLDTSLAIRSLCNPFRGSRDSETPLFWIVYVCTGFEAGPGRDGDPDTEGNAFGLSDTAQRQVSMCFLEGIHDRLVQIGGARVAAGLTLEKLKARTAAHEIGHQFQLGDLTDRRDPGHRPRGLMDRDAAVPADAAFYFDPEDVAKLRVQDTGP